MNNKKIIRQIIAVGFIVMVLWSYLPNVFSKNDQLDGPFFVTKIVDGDTIYVAKGKELKIRLIGINTPERDMPYYKEATDYTASLVENKSVYLLYDQERFDKYGRTLAYVYLEDKRTMINDEIIKNGWAKPLKIPPNTSYAEKFEAAYKQAKKNKLGMFH